MKIDPINHCQKFRQSLMWAMVHDLVAHPAMALTLYSRPAVWLHNYTSHRAWKRGDVKTDWNRD